MEPPNLSRKAIRGLGKDFCKILATKMSVEGLQKKPIARKGVGAVQIGRVSKKDNKIYEDNASKKIRKE
jgi:hypothetical protein